MRLPGWLPKGKRNRLPSATEDEGDVPSRAGTDELKALLSGGTIASVFTYLALFNQFDCTLSPPFEMLNHNSIPWTYVFAPLFLWVIAAFLFHLTFLSLAYGAQGVWRGPRGLRWTNRAWRISDIAFMLGVIGVFGFAIAVPLRIADYFLRGGTYPASSKEVAACLKSLHEYLNGTASSP